MWPSAKRLSNSGLNTRTRCRAIWARRSRRISSSLLPLNMLPVITSIQPWFGRRLTTSIATDPSPSPPLRARLILAGFRVHPHPVSRRDERRDEDGQPGLERRRLQLRVGGRALDGGYRVLHHEIDRRRQL